MDARNPSATEGRRKRNHSDGSVLQRAQVTHARRNQSQTFSIRSSEYRNADSRGRSNLQSSQSLHAAACDSVHPDRLHLRRLVGSDRKVRRDSCSLAFSTRHDGAGCPLRQRQAIGHDVARSRIFFGPTQKVGRSISATVASDR